MSHKHDHVSMSSQLNRLRAAVLGANDGIVSTASVVMGVAGTGADGRAIFIAGMAALIAGALSMAVGEYISVSSQRDAEKAHHDKYHNDQSEPKQYTSPSQAGIASFLSFITGGLVPFLATILSPHGPTQLWITVGAVFVALLLTGYFSATIGGASRTRAIIRVVVGGLLAMAITYLVGRLFGAAVA